MSEKIAVVGSGQMGNGIAHVFAVAGFDVTMIDVSRSALERARATIEKNLGRQVEKKVIDASARDSALARISTNESLASAADAALVIEAATENEPLKRKILAGRGLPPHLRSRRAGAERWPARGAGSRGAPPALAVQARP